MISCGVKLTCGIRGKLAIYWYYVADGLPVFVGLDAKKPTKSAVPCCQDCAVEIERRIQYA